MLSILIPARNEEFLQNTIDDIIAHAKGEYEILVGLDGYDPVLKEDKHVRIYKAPLAIGQRAMTNKLADLAVGEYVMKVDAHCSFSEGFDVEMVKDMKPNRTLVPALLNLYVFDWVCTSCGKREYQSKEPFKCCGEVAKDIKWQIKHKPICTSFYFDTNLIFNYNSRQGTSILSETMAIQGSGFMMTKQKYFDLNICDEKFGSWGQQGVEVACKTWLSGGEVMCTRNAFMGHFFREPMGFPYPIDTKQIDTARELSKKLFLDNTWECQIYPLAWLVERFRPLPDWHEESGRVMLEHIYKQALSFNKA